ncbi:hypothetical protein GCM10009834_47660 [Streptomonospora arabica]
MKACQESAGEGQAAELPVPGVAKVHSASGVGHLDAVATAGAAAAGRVPAEITDLIQSRVLKKEVAGPVWRERNRTSCTEAQRKSRDFPCVGDHLSAPGDRGASRVSPLLMPSTWDAVHRCVHASCEGKTALTGGARPPPIRRVGRAALNAGSDETASTPPGSCRCAARLLGSAVAGAEAVRTSPPPRRGRGFGPRPARRVSRPGPGRAAPAGSALSSAVTERTPLDTRVSPGHYLEHYFR